MAVVFRNHDLVNRITAYTWATPVQQLTGIYFLLEKELDIDLHFNANIRASISCDKEDDVWFQIEKKYNEGQNLVAQIEIAYPNIRDILQIIYAVLINYRLDIRAFENEMLPITELSAEYETFVQTVATPQFFRSLEKPITKNVQKDFIQMMHILQLPRRRLHQKKI